MPPRHSAVSIDELEKPDTRLLTTPIHTFTVPETLKAGIDKVASFSQTFRGTPNGQIDFLVDRPTFIVIVAGSFFSDDRTRQPDHLTPYLHYIIATISITDLCFIFLEGLSRSEEVVDAAYQSAREQARAL